MTDVVAEDLAVLIRVALPFQTPTVVASRSIARRAGCCHDQPCRFSSHQVPSTVYDAWNRRPINVFTSVSVHR